MNDKSFQKVAELNDAQILQLMDLFQGEWWTKGRSLEDTTRMLRKGGSLVFGLVDSRTTKLVGFARVLTDKIFKAIVFDLIVHPDYRKQGLGRLLMDWIMNHPVIARCRHVELYCVPEMVAFYWRWGLSQEHVANIELLRAFQSTGDSSTTQHATLPQD